MANSQISSSVFVKTQLFIKIKYIFFSTASELLKVPKNRFPMCFKRPKSIYQSHTTKLKNLLKNTRKNFKNHVWTWPRTWPERGRNVATNVAETWPTKWLIGHVVTWPACSAMLWPCSGHVEHDRNVATNVARTWPHCDERGQKRGQQHGRGQLTNVAHTRRTRPATLATLRATFEVFSTYFHFFRFCSCSMRLPVTNALHTSAHP